MQEKRRDRKGRILKIGEVQRADGKYMFRYTDTHGVRQTIYSWKLVSTDKAPSGARCDMALRDMEKDIARDLNDGIKNADASHKTLNELFDEFIQLRIDLRPSTIANYCALYNKHIRHDIGCCCIKQIKHTDIQKLYIKLLQDHHLSIGTVEKIHSMLIQAFNNAVMDNLLRVNPTVNALTKIRKTESYEPRKRHALTEAEQTIFISYIYADHLFRKFGPLFTVLLGTGMRIGEALGLRWCDCDFKNGTISVNHTIMYKHDANGKYTYRISMPKTVSGIRTIPMLQEVKNALLQEKQRKRVVGMRHPFSVDSYTDFIFLNSSGKVYTQAYIFDTIQRITDSYNRKEKARAIEEKRKPFLLPKISAHILRHTFCTRLYEHQQNIKVIQEVMGHKHSDTTLDIYTDVTEKTKSMSFASLEGKMKLA